MMSHEELFKAEARLTAWLESAGFAGYDPYDALASPLLRPAVLLGRRPAAALVHALRLCPVNLRPLLGIPQCRYAKAMGVLLGTYARKYRLSHHPRHLRTMSELSRRLEEQATRCYGGRGWGYEFPWPNRSFFASPGTPTVVNTSFVACAMLDGYQATGDASYLASAQLAAEFVLRGLRRLGRDDSFSFSYTPLDRRAVHNANLLGAALLARTYAETGDRECRRAAEGALRFTLERQCADGSWPYGEAPNDRWVDGLHTGYVLCALAECIEGLDREDLLPALRRGYQYYAQRLIETDGTARYSARSPYPLDAHTFAQAVITHLRLAFLDPALIDRAARIAARAVHLFQRGDGAMGYQINRRYAIRIPYVRWSLAWMQRALVDLQSQIEIGGDECKRLTISAWTSSARR